MSFDEQIITMPKDKYPSTFSSQIMMMMMMMMMMRLLGLLFFKSFSQRLQF